MYDFLNGRFVIKSIRLKIMPMQGLAMVEGVHVGDDKDSLFTHKHHMT
jgi:hypothetical protein